MKIFLKALESPFVVYGEHKTFKQKRAKIEQLKIMRKFMEVLRVCKRKNFPHKKQQFVRFAWTTLDDKKKFFDFVSIA